MPYAVVQRIKFMQHIVAADSDSMQGEPTPFKTHGVRIGPESATSAAACRLSQYTAVPVFPAKKRTCFVSACFFLKDMATPAQPAQPQQPLHASTVAAAGPTAPVAAAIQAGVAADASQHSSRKHTASLSIARSVWSSALGKQKGPVSRA
jgi:hypothetical protein